MMFLVCNCVNGRHTVCVICVYERHISVSLSNHQYEPVSDTGWDLDALHVCGTLQLYDAVCVRSGKNDILRDI